MYIVAPPFLSSHENCPGHVYFPLTCGNFRLLRAVMLGNGHLGAVTLSGARLRAVFSRTVISIIRLSESYSVLD